MLRRKAVSAADCGDEAAGLLDRGQGAMERDPIVWV
jgi:hypothetical protein